MKISVLTPSFNCGQYIERAIQSVLNQNYENFEHIVIDGGSKDDTIAILKKYDHLKWVSKPDKGQSDAMNNAFNMSSGDIIVYLNADDEFALDAFNEIVKTFKNSPKADVVVGNLIYSSPDGILTRVPSHKYLDILPYWQNLFPNNPVSYFYKREVQNQVGEFPIDEHFAMDMWFLLIAYKKFSVVKINKVLGTFHSDGNNKTAITDAGVNLHKTVKKHLRTKSPQLLPYFYSKFLWAKIKQQS